jgi:uncharacterized membrane protein YhiD involved in acid resistance
LYSIENAEWGNIMVSFIDMIKNKFIEEFSGALTVERVFISLIVAFIIGLFIIWIYKVTYTGVLFNKGFSCCLVLLSMITSVIIATISSNLALSLGMVGALSIVRFRTAVKDPVDTAFMFWAIASGIMTGAGLIFISIFSSAILGILYAFLNFTGIRFSSSPYLLIIRYQPEAKEEVEASLKQFHKFRIKSKTVSKQGVELALEIKINNKNTDMVETIQGIKGVTDASLISCAGEAAR